MEAYLTQTAKVPGDQVLAFCRGDAVRARLFSTLTPMALRIHTGDRLVVVWIGQGALITPSRLPAFIMADTRFSEAIDPNSETSAIINTTVTPELLDGWFQSYLPAGVLRVYLLDAMHGGQYRGLDLQGPVAHDFRDFPGTLAISASDSGPSMPGNLRQSFIACWGAGSDAGTRDGLVTAEELQTCLINHLAGSGETPSSVGQWANQPLLATGLDSATPPLPKGRPGGVGKPASGRVAKSAIRWTGLSLGAAALGASAITYSQALSLSKTFEDPEAHYPDEQSANAALDRYRSLSTATYGLWALGGVGLTVGGLTFVVGPQSTSLSGSF